MKKYYTLITGGTAGIGFELAKLFAADGHNLIIAARDTSEHESAKATPENGTSSLVTISKDLNVNQYGETNIPFYHRIVIVQN